VLPHVLRWNRPAAEGPLTGAARAIGAGGPDELIGRIEAMTEALGLPRRLRDVGMERTLFDPIARHVLGDAVVRSNPRAVSSADDVLEVLDAAW
jgi:alcohol dehydrogenase class IV